MDSGGLAVVIHRCLEKNPERRYQQTTQLAAELKSLRTSPGAYRGARKPRPWMAIAASIAVLAVLAGAALWRIWPSLYKPRPRIVAVRTFRDVSADPSFEYYAASITNEIRSRLSLLRSIRTMSRAVADRYNDEDLPRLCTEDGVQYLLAGNVAATREKVDLHFGIAGTLRHATPCGRAATIMSPAA